MPRIERRRSRRRRLENHPALRRLRRHGHPLQVAARIEDQLIALGQKARAGPLYLSPDWIVALESSLEIFDAESVLGVGPVASKTNGEPSVKLRFFSRDRHLANDVTMTLAEASEALAGVRVKFPWLLVQDVPSFEKRFKADRDGCAAEVDARKAQDASTS